VTGVGRGRRLRDRRGRRDVSGASALAATRIPPRGIPCSA